MEKSEDGTPFLYRVLWVWINQNEKKRGNSIPFICLEISFSKLTNYFSVLRDKSLIYSLSFFGTWICWNKNIYQLTTVIIIANNIT